MSSSGHPRLLQLIAAPEPKTLGQGRTGPAPDTPTVPLDYRPLCRAVIAMLWPHRPDGAALSTLVFVTAFMSRFADQSPVTAHVLTLAGDGASAALPYGTSDAPPALPLPTHDGVNANQSLRMASRRASQQVHLCLRQGMRLRPFRQGLKALQALHLSGLDGPCHLAALTGYQGLRRLTLAAETPPEVVN